MPRERPPLRRAPCPRDGRWFDSLTGLRYHLEREHPDMGTRDRSLARDLSRREADWFGVRP